MIEIIKRIEGQKSERHQLSGRPQVSYNSDGRLVIRLIDTQESDQLIVLDQYLSNMVIGFTQDKISNRMHMAVDLPF